MLAFQSAQPVPNLSTAPSRNLKTNTHRKLLGGKAELFAKCAFAKKGVQIENVRDYKIDIEIQYFHFFLHEINFDVSSLL